MPLIHLPPGTIPPPMAAMPHTAVVAAGVAVDPGWRAAVAAWLVDGGCRWMLAWGTDASAWDDAVDWVVLERCGFADIPEDRMVMTTWHDDEPLDEVLDFAHAVGDGERPVVLVDIHPDPRPWIAAAITARDQA